MVAAVSVLGKYQYNFALFAEYLRGPLPMTLPPMTVNKVQTENSLVATLSKPTSRMLIEWLARPYLTTY